MSFHVKLYKCIVCNGFFEIWTHNESEEEYTHKQGSMSNKNLSKLCKCEHPEKEEITYA